MFRKRVIAVGALMILLAGCRSKVTVDDFFNEVATDSDYKKEYVSEYLVLTSEYRPAELICMSELVKGKRDFIYNDAEFKKELSKYSNSCYFDFTISAKDKRSLLMDGVKNQGDYATRLADLTYKMPERCFLLIDNKDTVKATLCNFSNTFGNNPDLKMLFIFPGKEMEKAEKTIEMIYRDSDFGLKEKVVFTFKKAELTKNLPEIKEIK